MRGASRLMLRARQAVASPGRTLTHLLLRRAGGREAAALALEKLTLERFYDDEVGRAYGVGRREKAGLVERFQAATAQVPSGTSWLYHVVLASEILSVPPDVAGDVIECGCWKGASTSSLSLVCRLTGRRLIVCDSFEGLPEDEAGASHEYPHLSVYGYYQKGMYAGRLDEVRANIGRCGDLSVCEFVPGFFSDTLAALDRPLAFAFLDVDLASSMRDCLRHVWPLLAEGGAVYTDDSCDMEVVRVWFDEAWWQRELGRRAPGYVGSGCGLPLGPDYSSLGYARKLSDPSAAYDRVSWLYYPDAPSRQEGAQFPAEGTTR